MSSILKPLYKGAVFFDIDGTLVDERQEIFVPTDATKASIQKLKQNGYLVGIATGRAKCYLPNIGIDFNCYVTCNGAVAEIDGQVIHNESISKDKILHLCNYFAKNDIAYATESREICRYNPAKEELLFSLLKTFNISPEAFVPFSDNQCDAANEVIIAFDTEEQFASLQADLSDEYQILRHHNHLSADIMPVGMSKAVGINAIISAAGIDISDTYAFGDDLNDIEMLSAVGCGVAMTPHAEPLEAVAKMFTGSVKDEGITAALTKLGLI